MVVSQKKPPAGPSGEFAPPEALFLAAYLRMCWWSCVDRRRRGAAAPTLRWVRDPQLGSGSGSGSVEGGQAVVVGR